MTESELIEAVTSYFELVFIAVTLYVSVCSGYLVVAYLIGSKLTKSQMVVVSSLYTFIAVLMAYAAMGFLNRTINYLEGLDTIERYGVGGHASPLVIVILPLILIFGVLACLKFMWDIRHPKTD